MLVNVNENVYRFTNLENAAFYAKSRCRDDNGSYIIIDTVIDKIVDKWNC